MIKSKLILAVLLSAFAAVSFAQTTPSSDAPASAAKHGKHMKHKHAMGAASSASDSMK